MLFPGTARQSGWRLLLPILAYGLPLAFIVAPLAAFLIYSFFRMDHGQIVYDLSLLNYRRFAAEGLYPAVLWQTCLLCLAVAVLAVLIGYPVAFLLAMLQGRRRYI